MKITVTTKLTGIDGKQLSITPNVPLTLKDVCITSILTPVEGDGEKQKWEKYEIFKKLVEPTTLVELKAEEIAVIKKAIGRMQPPLIMGQCFELLEKG